MKQIGGRVAIVTGASRGLGRQIAQTLFDHGLKVVLTARNADELEAVRAAFDRSGSRTLAVAGDITQPGHRAALLEAAATRFGELDILVNNAGNDHPEEFAETTLERVSSMFDLNVIALMDMTRLALPGMLRRGEGHIVNLGSVAGLAPVPYASVYSATKHAIIGFSQSLRYEVADRGVGVSVVCPGFVREAGLFHDNTGGQTSGELTVSPEQVADGVVRAITGNRSRVIVSPAMLRLSPLATAVAPGIPARIARLSGSYDTMQGIAARLRSEEQAGGTTVEASGRPSPRPAKAGTPAP